MSGILDGKVGLVTGAARGQGREITTRAAAAGATVVGGDVLDMVRSLADETGGAATGVRLDVTDPESWRQVVHDTVGRYGHLDFLINNAGVLRRAPLEEEEREGFEDTWRINCLGAFLGVHTALPHLKESRGGSIVNTLSTAAVTGWADHGAYVSSKWALRGFTKVAALELAPYGVRVNAIMPGPVLTPMVLREDDPGARERLSRTPLGRAGEPADIAELVLYLISDAASFVTGAEVVIDGGQTVGVMAAAPRLDD